LHKYDVLEIIYAVTRVTKQNLVNPINKVVHSIIIFNSDLY